MFTVKATYRNETRKLTFPDLTFFPSYDQLCHQLYRVFPISNNYYFSKLLFYPDSSRDSRILIRKEVHSRDDYQAGIAPYYHDRRTFRGALLKFSIHDETPHKMSSIASSDQSRWSRSSDTIHTASPLSSVTAIPQMGDHVPSPFNVPTGHPFVIPPPPVLYRSPVQPQVPMDVDHRSPVALLHPNSPRPPVPERVHEYHRLDTSPPAMLSSHPQPQPQPQQSPKSAAPLACCSVSQAKLDIKNLLESFRTDLDQVIVKNLGNLSMENEVQPKDEVIAPTVVLPTPLPFQAPFQVPASLDRTVPWWCLTCGQTSLRVWYACATCPYIICFDCARDDDNFSSHTRQAGSAHTLLRSSLSPSTVVPSLPSVMTPSIPQYSICPAGVPVPAPEPVAAPHMSQASVPASPVHTNIICDMCNKTVTGVRHKCLDCPDYDLCPACFESGSAEVHNPFHEFFDIEEPGRVIVHTVFSGQGEKDANIPARSPPVSPVRSKTPIAHNALCDLCDSRIRGDRYKCLHCPDFDVCSTCYVITPEQHPKHGFVKVSNPDDLKVIPSDSQQHHATCNVCLKPIFGVRYKCMHASCPDFDLCSNCEALPIPVHPDLHPLLKMKAADTIIPTVYRVGEISLINDSPYMRSPSRVRRFRSRPLRSRSSSPTFPHAFADTIHAPPAITQRSPGLFGPRSPHPYEYSVRPLACRSRSRSRSHPYGYPMRPRSRSRSWSRSRSRSPIVVPVVDDSAPLPVSATSQWSPPHTAVAGSSGPHSSVRSVTPEIRGRHGYRSRSPSASPPPRDVRKIATEVQTENLEPPSIPISSLASSTAGFTLPPLALDGDNDIFRELLPKVAKGLRHILQENSASQIRDNQNTGSVQTDGETFVDSSRQSVMELEKPQPIVESPLTGQEALLRHPSTNSNTLDMIQKNTSRVNQSLAALLNNNTHASFLATSSPLAPSISSVELVESKQPFGQVDSTGATEEVLRATFVYDETVPDGQIFPPGAEFVKAWCMVNDGSKEWPEEARVKFVAGEDFSAGESKSIGPVAPGAVTNVWTGELKAPETAGRYVGYWRLTDGQGNDFGHSIWIDITVAEASHLSDGTGEESLASSVIIMPQAAPARSSVDSDSQDIQDAPAVRLESAVEYASSEGGGSDSSSVSLISVPSVEGEEEDPASWEEVWEDSRSQVLVSPQPERRGLEYVVLYDESSDDD